MPVRPVLNYPHPSLKQVAPAVDPRRCADLAELAADLVDTMRSYEHCVGLAATQLGLMARLIAIDVSEHPKAASNHGLLVLVNPCIVLASGSDVGREGCLSIPELTANVRRSTEIVVEASTVASDQRVIDADGFEARCLQHEIDHLDGILFLDRVDSLSNVFRRKRSG
ncbi:MAG: peptide deformylase [Solirubrobacterales bacterium]